MTATNAAARPATIVVAVLLAGSVSLLGVLARPNPPSLSTNVTGDAALAARVRPLLQGALDRVSVALYVLTASLLRSNPHWLCQSLSSIES